MTITTYHTSMRESELQQCLIDAAQRMGWLCYHTFDSRRSQPGFPDVVMIKAPSVIFCELKTQKGKLSPTQEVWRDVLQQCTHSEYHLVRPVAGEDALGLDEILGRLAE